MAHLSATDVLTSEERWQRWRQRGRDSDARFKRRVRTVFVWIVLVLAAGLLLFFVV
jgi:hypothetical protein